MTDYYRRSSPSMNYYTSSASTEPSMRDELINMLDGKYPEISKRQTGLLRKMNRDSNGNRILCGCVDPVTKEPDRSKFCPQCWGMSYLWTEEYCYFYRTVETAPLDSGRLSHLVDPGLINTVTMVFYVRYSSEINTDDRIIELELDAEGEVITPVKRRAAYRIKLPWDYRCDNGRLEYWKLFTHSETLKFLNSHYFGESNRVI